VTWRSAKQPKLERAGFRARLTSMPIMPWHGAPLETGAPDGVGRQVRREGKGEGRRGGRGRKAPEPALGVCKVCRCTGSRSSRGPALALPRPLRGRGKASLPVPWVRRREAVKTTDKKRSSSKCRAVRVTILA
jgi:hypothetical protein